MDERETVLRLCAIHNALLAIAFSSCIGCDKWMLAEDVMLTSTKDVCSVGQPEGDMDVVMRVRVTSESSRSR